MLNILKVEKTVGSRQLIHIRGVPDPSRCTTGECPQTNPVEKPMYERFFQAHARNISYFRTAKNNEMYGISQVKKKKKSIADGTQLACMTIMSAGLHHPERKPSPIHLNHVRYK